MGTQEVQKSAMFATIDHDPLIRAAIGIGILSFVVITNFWPKKGIYPIFQGYTPYFIGIFLKLHKKVFLRATNLVQNVCQFTL